MSAEQTPDPEDNVTTAVRMAKSYVRKLWSGEQIENVGLEEIIRETDDIWQVTIGFNRPWDRAEPRPYGLMFASSPVERTYKTARVNLRTMEVERISIRSSSI